jgi:transitional endoplasmic reticulum ATPase
MEPLTTPVSHISAGIAAQERGDLEAAHRHCLEAARLLLAEARQTKSPRIRRQRTAYADQLLAQAATIEAQRVQRSQQQNVARKHVTPPLADDEQTPDWLLAERPTVRLDDVAGLADVKEQIALKLIYPFSHPDTAERFGVRPGGGLLLYGPPGTGKTYIARAVAGELDAAFFVAKASNLMSQWFGKAEQNIAALFAAARRQDKAVIFLDEIEALIPKRSATSSSVMPRVISEFLAQTQSLGDGNGALLLLGATNEPWAIDDAALRPGRFDELIYVGLPDRTARLRLLEMGLKNRPLAGDVDLEQLADRLEGYSGADITYLCTRAGQRAFLAAIEQDQERIIEAADFDAILAERRSSVTPEMLKRYDRFRAGRTTR